MNDTIRMQISAFVDGELPDGEADLLLRRMGQDAELRQAAAEFLELGRAIRGESSVAGVDQLRARIAAAIDDKAVVDEATETEDATTRSLKPLVGIAVAASVALVALIGLQYTTDTGGIAPVEDGIAEVAEDTGVTVPPLEEDILRQYRQTYGVESDQGANDSNTQFVTLRDSEEVPAEEDSEEETEATEEVSDEAAQQP